MNRVPSCLIQHIDIMYLVDQSNISAKNCNLHKFATIPIVFFKSITSDMHHPKTYMYINFQQNQACRTGKTVRTNFFAKNCKLHKFATTDSNFEKNQVFETCDMVKHTYVSIFSKIGLVDKSKLCTQIYV